MSAAPTTIRVATYNVHACVGSDGRHDPNRVAAVIAELDADIVALQEFTYPASVAIETRMPVALTMADRVRVRVGANPSKVNECFGNALLTRHRIVEVHRFDLSIERREPRGAIAATIDVRGTIVHVLATHLGLRVRERRFQVRQILDYLDSVRHTLVVVLGDFNDWLPGRSVVHVLDDRLGQPPRPASFPVHWPIVAARSDLGESAAARFAESSRTPRRQRDAPRIISRRRRDRLERSESEMNAADPTDRRSPSPRCGRGLSAWSERRGAPRCRCPWRRHRAKSSDPDSGYRTV